MRLSNFLNAFFISPFFRKSYFVPYFKNSMSSTYLSILSADTNVRQLMNKLVDDTQFFKGYVGEDNSGLQDFIREQQEVKHVLFLKPAKDYMTTSSPINLKKLGDVDVVVLGKDLPKDLIGFVQEYKTAGFVNPFEIKAHHIIEIIDAIQQNGFYANEHIPNEYWAKSTPYVFPRPRPDLTIGEEEVLRLLCHNFSVKEICDKLDKKEPAIRAHITNLREKLYAKSLLEIVVITMANMWIKIDPSYTSSDSPFL